MREGVDTIAERVWPKVAALVHRAGSPRSTQSSVAWRPDATR